MKKIAENLLTVFIALLFSFLLAELGARLFLSAPQTVLIAPSESVAPIVDKEKKELVISEHPDEGGVYRGSPTGKRLRPNRRITIENHRLSRQKVLIETNSLGYRNPEVPKKEIGEKTATRILFLGDSITFQDYLNEEDTFVRRVEKQARQEGRDWETINAAVGAISLKTELAILQETGMGLRPDVVVLGFYLNDFQESKGVTIIPLPWLLQKSWFAYYLVEWVNQQRGKHLMVNELELGKWKAQFKTDKKFSPGHFNKNQEAFNQMILESFHDFGAAWSEASWRHMRPLFAELKRLSVDHEFKLVIVGFPVYQQVYTSFVDDTPQEQLRRIGRELDIPVLDLLPALREEALRLQNPSIYESEKYYDDLFYDQCHHTAAGSALIAKEITHFLQAKLQD